MAAACIPVLHVLQGVYDVILSQASSLFALLRPAKTIRLNQRNLRIVKQLGEGGFSFVYYVIDTSTNESFALKKVRIELPEHHDRLQAEIHAHRSVDSPHVVKLIDHQMIKQAGEPKEGLLLLPLLNGGSVSLVDLIYMGLISRLFSLIFGI